MDAQRNRDALIAVARQAFATSPEPVALENIARDAGVGIGTLYRNFPTRESLVEAVYASELDAVTASAATLVTQLPPRDALMAWMHRYAEFTATKRGMAATLRAGWASGRITTPHTRERINAAIALFLEAGAADGSLRGDVEADDVTAMVLGVFLSTAGAAAAAGAGATVTTAAATAAAAAASGAAAATIAPPEGSAPPASSASPAPSAEQVSRLLSLVVDALRP